MPTDDIESTAHKPVPLRLGTRASALARWQADWVAGRLRELGAAVEMVFITTEGDVTKGPLGAAGGTGLFTKEIQRALLDERVDVAVHSLKDLPTDAVEGLTVAAVPTRESPIDALVSPIADSLESLPNGARVGTGSTRRRSQLLHQRPDLRISDVRGNVDTRLRKLDAGEFDAIVLAEAGLIRLGWSQRISGRLGPPILFPAVGQGALGIEVRAADQRTRKIVGQLDDPASHAAVMAERGMLRELRGGCLAPVGAWGRIEGSELQLEGVVLSLDGQRRILANCGGPCEDAIAIGERVARELVAGGARELINEARK